jgi:aspartyl aminopeptidase
MDSKENIEQLLKASKLYSSPFIDALNQCVTPFHTAQYCKTRLDDAGFKELFQKYSFNFIH